LGSGIFSREIFTAEMHGRILRGKCLKDVWGNFQGGEFFMVNVTQDVSGDCLDSMQDNKTVRAVV